MQISDCQLIHKGNYGSLNVCSWMYVDKMCYCKLSHNFTYTYVCMYMYIVNNGSSNECDLLYRNHLLLHIKKMMTLCLLRYSMMASCDVT